MQLICRVFVACPFEKLGESLVLRPNSHETDQC
jgi:hypothetical protein